MPKHKSPPTRQPRHAQDSSTPNEKTVDARELPQSDPKGKPFVPEDLDTTVIAIPLLKSLKEESAKRKKKPTIEPEVYSIIIDLNLEYPGGRDTARDWVLEAAREIVKERGADKNQGVNEKRITAQYLFAKLEGDVIRKLVSRDREENAAGKRKDWMVTGSRAIYHIWPDFRIRALINKSVSTVKADAAHASFSAFGDGIVWAVLDSGIDHSHPHFKLHENLVLGPPLAAMDFTGEGRLKQDPNGHGTHVAGIIAGQMSNSNGSRRKRSLTSAYVRNRDEEGEIKYSEVKLDAIAGMAPKCKLVNMRVLDEEGGGDVSSLIEAIAKIQEVNGHGRRLLIHGVNISVGNDFDPEWFACGQSPLCVEVNRLVSSGVVVVVAAGNSGYGSLETKYTEVISAGMSLTVNDPGNAEQAITVGSTHKDMPHVYGVSYFSSKGPTGDGRAKPDIVAPGEKIISCAAGKAREKVREEVADCYYVEDSGTSMAAPHVSGVIAAFLSVRREFIGQPEKVKQIFLSTATDLKRERYFQGYGLVDLMRAIQSV
jgi:serine protease AprX